MKAYRQILDRQITGRLFVYGSIFFGKKDWHFAPDDDSEMEMSGTAENEFIAICDAECEYHIFIIDDE